MRRGDHESPRDERQKVKYSRVSRESVTSNFGSEDAGILQEREEELDEQLEDAQIGGKLILAVVIICALLLLGLLDSMTTKYAKRASTAFALWTVVNAPWSFLVYMFVITLLIICCLPYGTLLRIHDFSVPSLSFNSHIHVRLSTPSRSCHPLEL